jgi:hypothetical protein
MSKSFYLVVKCRNEEQIIKCSQEITGFCSTFGVWKESEIKEFVKLFPYQKFYRKKD